MYKMKIPNWNGLKLGTVVILDSLSKPIDLGFKRSRSGAQVPSVRISGVLLPNPH